MRFLGRGRFRIVFAVQEAPSQVCACLSPGRSPPIRPYQVRLVIPTLGCFFIVFVATDVSSSPARNVHFMLPGRWPLMSACVPMLVAHAVLFWRASVLIAPCKTVGRTAWDRFRRLSCAGWGGARLGGRPPGSATQSDSDTILKEKESDVWDAFAYVPASLTHERMSSTTGMLGSTSES